MAITSSALRAITWQLALLDLLSFASFAGRQFEDTFENTHWRKVNQMLLWIVWKLVSESRWLLQAEHWRAITSMLGVLDTWYLDAITWILGCSSGDLESAEAWKRDQVAIRSSAPGSYYLAICSARSARSDHNVLRSLRDVFFINLAHTSFVRKIDQDHLKQFLTQLHSHQSSSRKDKRLRVM